MAKNAGRHDQQFAGEQHHRIASGSGELDAVVTTPARSSGRWAVLVHGGPGGDKNGPDQLFGRLAADLAAVGVGSLRYDARGSGQASGTWREVTLSTLNEDLSHARGWLNVRFRPRRIALIGESLGATTILMNLDDSPADVVVLLYPAIWLLQNVIESWVTPDALAEARTHGHIVRDGEQVGLTFLTELLAVRDVSGPLGRLQSPALLVHGLADSEVPPWQSRKAALMVAGPVRLHLLPNAGHGLEQPAAQLSALHETTQWLTGWL